MSTTYYTTKSGYERTGAGQSEAAIHQLLVIAEGADPHKVFSDGDYNVHHKNHIPWDNRPENVELLTKAEHNSEHWDPDMLMGDHIPESLCSKIRSDYRGDATITDLVEVTGRTKSAVHKHLRGACSHCDDDITLGRKGPRDGPWKDKEIFRDLYCEKGLNLREVGERLGCSQACASIWKRKHGF